MYSQSVLSEVNSLCRERGIYHIHDEAYEYFVYDDATHFSPGSITDAGAHTISMYYIQPAEFLIGRGGVVLGSIYASGPVGRMGADEALRQITRRESTRKEQEGQGG